MGPLLLVLALVGSAHAEDPAPPAVPPEPPPEALPEELPPLVKEPALVAFVEAPYPEAARAAQVEGKVLLAIEIDEAGAVTNVDVLRGTSTDVGLEAAAVEAARQFRFSPAEDATGPVPVVVEFEYGFVLDAASQEDAVPEAQPSEVAELPVNLDGVLVEMGTRRPLAGIVVRIEPAGVEATTDADGRYTFRGVPGGAVTLRVVHPGYDTLEQPVQVSLTELTTVKLWIRNKSYNNAGVIGVYRQPSAEVSKRTISMEEIRRVPGTFGDPIRVVQTLPGAARTPFGTGFLVIRGSNPEDSGVYVDGIRIPYVYHIGGFESVLNPDLVGAVDYLPGGFGPRYGRSTGGVVDVRTTTEFPERTRVTWSTDLLDSGALVTGTVGKKKQHGFGVAARRSYVDAILPLFLDEGFVARPQWWDYQAKYQWQGDGPNEFSLLLFGFQDVLIVSTPPGFAQSTDQDGQGDLGTTYSTHRILARWEHTFSDTLAFHFIPSFGNDYAKFSLGNAWKLEQSQWLAEIRAELPWTPNEHVKIVPGIDFIGGIAPFSIELPFDPAQFAETDPLAEREPYIVEDVQPGWGPDLYLLAELRPLADTERLLLTPGVRFNFLSIPGEYDIFALDPRFSGRFSVFPGGRVKGSVGIYHQPPQPFQSYRADDKPVDLHFERSLSGSLGWEQDISPAVQVDAEVFYKAMDNLVVGNPEFESLDDQFFVNGGRGRAYGLEVLLRHAPIDRFFGWISYTLSRSERRDQPDEDWYLFDYDQTHILIGTAGYKLPWDIEVSAKAEYVTGNTTTPYSLGVYDIDQDSYQAFATGAENSERLPPYWAVSGRIDKLFTFRHWQLSLYVDLLNVLHGTNPEFELYNYDYTEKTYIQGLPFIPSPGFEARFQF
jgi:TonB family protein